MSSVAPPARPSSAVPFFTRLRRAWVALAGTAAFAVSPWAFQLGMGLFNQAGFVRMLGVMAVGTALIALLSLALAVPAAWLTLRVPGKLWPGLRLGCYAVLVGSVIALGLCVFFWGVGLAPRPWLVTSTLVWLVLMAAFWRYDAPAQRFLTRTLLRGGVLALALPWLAAPWVIHGLIATPMRIAESPRPPVAPVLRSGAPKRIVLVTFDALRARSTALHTPALANSPTLVALARESSWFTDCHTTGESTVMGLSSILTGVGPERIFPRVASRMGYLPEGALTSLAGYLAAGGYQAYYATMLLHPSTLGVEKEFDRGIANTLMFTKNEFSTQAFLPLGAAGRWLWDKVDRTPAPAQGKVIRTRLYAARASFDFARETLKASPAQTFMWVHLGVPHNQYYRLPAGAGEDPLRHAARAERANMDYGRDPVRMARAERIYEGYVRFGDAELGRFVRGLKQDGLWDDTLLIVTSDHGEAFDPDAPGHGLATLTEDTTHVPLLVHEPGQRTARRVDAPTSLLDITPTVLARVYRDVPGGLAGIPLLDREVPGDRTVFSIGMVATGGLNRPPVTMAAYQTDFKYWRDNRSGVERLFDRRGDRRDSRDVAGRYPERLAAMRTQTDRVLAGAD
jgi:arylsulfatase